MSSIHIRDIDPDVLRKLKRLARIHHRSLQGELHAILEDAARRAPPEGEGKPLDLVFADSGNAGSWSREEIYGDEGR